MRLMSTHPAGLGVANGTPVQYFFAGDEASSDGTVPGTTDANHAVRYGCSSGKKFDVSAFSLSAC
jgi:hypothetical protein